MQIFYLFVYKYFIYYVCDMKITETLRKLNPGQSLVFDLKSYESILSINTRLKRRGEGEYTTAIKDGSVTVTRKK